MSTKSKGRLDADFKPRITVVGVGGGGGNAVNNMIRSQLEGVEFVVMNTDYQALSQSLTDVDRRVQLGHELTKGLGAGSAPDVGRAAAEESMEEINVQIDGSHMVFIAAGMGGGTGTGAAPVVARAAREKGMLTVGVVTKPFHFEGSHRMRSAEQGIEDLQKYVDTLIIIPNQNLFRIANEHTTFADAFRMADDVLYAGVRGITDLMIMPGLINLDFADVRTVMREMGKAMMGTGEAENEGRAIAAAEAAISNPLLDDVSMKGARGVLISVTGGMDMTLYEVDEAANRIREEVDPDANIIFGSTFDERLNGRVRVSVVATGIDAAALMQSQPKSVFLSGVRPGSSNATNQQNATITKVAAEPHLRIVAENPSLTYPQETGEGAEESFTPSTEVPFDESVADYDEEQPKVGFFSRLLGRRSTQQSTKAKPRIASDRSSEMGLFASSKPETNNPYEKSQESESLKPSTTTANPSLKEAPQPPLDDKAEELDIPAFMRRNH